MYRSSARLAELERENRELKARLGDARRALRRHVLATLATWMMGPLVLLWIVVLCAAALGACLGVAGTLDRALGLQ